MLGKTYPTVIKRAGDSQATDILVQHSRCLSLLNRGHLSLGKHHKDGYVLFPLQSVDGCGAGITPAGTNDGETVSVC